PLPIDAGLQDRLAAHSAAWGDGLGITALVIGMPVLLQVTASDGIAANVADWRIGMQRWDGKHQEKQGQEETSIAVGAAHDRWRGAREGRPTWWIFIMLVPPG